MAFLELPPSSDNAGGYCGNGTINGHQQGGKGETYFIATVKICRNGTACNSACTVATFTACRSSGLGSFIFIGATVGEGFGVLAAKA